MISDQLKNMVNKVAETNPCGFTLMPRQKKLATTGYVVASKQTQDCIGKQGLWKVVKFYLRHPAYCIGGWRNEDGIMQYDASMVYYDINEAVQAAIQNEQRAFYNLYTGKEIMQNQYSSFLCRKIA